MKTPKEKAKELVDKHCGKMFYLRDGYVYEAAKQCALITVEIILNSGLLINQPSLEKSNKCKPNIYHKEYWEKVKKEIKKL